MPIPYARARRRALTGALAWTALAATVLGGTDWLLAGGVANGGERWIWAGSIQALLLAGSGVVVHRVLVRCLEREHRGRILKAAVEAASEAVLITDDSGTIEYVNPAFTRITGWRRDEVVGRNPRVLKSGRQDDSFYRRMWSTLRAGRAFQGRFVNRRADGSLYTQEATLTPVLGPSGIEHFVGVARDVTERELLERQLREAQSAEAVGRVVSEVSHDFRNLLGIVQAQVELARTADEEERQPTEELEEIARATERGVELTRKLLTLGGAGDLERVPVSLVEIVEELRPALRAVVGERVTLDLRLPPDDRIPVLGDRGSIEQILVNLATNARDALPGTGTMVVELDRVDEVEAGPDDAVVGVRRRPAEGWARLRVVDDGEGMEPETLRRMFEPFFTTKPRDRGTGLGMAMVARLVRLHGGAVTVSSRPGGGSTVSLFLPVAVGGVRSEEDASTDEAIPRGRGQQVLIAEDEGALLQAQMKALERLGYTPWAAKDGDEAVRILEQRGTEIDLVMIDLVMPGRGGKELWEEMGLMGLRDVPVVFMSGLTVPEAEGALPPDAESHFLEKPWTLGQLARKVSDALETRRSFPPAG